jgi:hypothetical protein
MSRVALVCALALIGVALATAFQSPVPLAMWSGKKFVFC